MKVNIVRKSLVQLFVDLQYFNEWLDARMTCKFLISWDTGAFWIVQQDGISLQHILTTQGKHVRFSLVSLVYAV